MQKINRNRCVVYARYSCHNQTEQSIEGQMHDCEKYAEAHGLQIVDKLDNIAKLINNEDIMNRIVDAIIEQQRTSNTNIEAIDALTKQLNTAERKINNIMSAIEEGIVTPTTKQRLHELEILRDDLEYEIVSKKAQRYRFTKSQLINSFKSIDLNAITVVQEKQNLIKRLIDKVYVWEDKILIFYNFTGRTSTDDTKDKEKSFDEIITAATDRCSAAAVYGTPDRNRTDD